MATRTNSFLRRKSALGLPVSPQTRNFLSQSSLAASARTDVVRGINEREQDFRQRQFGSGCIFAVAQGHAYYSTDPDWANFVSHLISLFKVNTKSILHWLMTIYALNTYLLGSNRRI